MHGKAKSRPRGLDFLAGGGEMGALMRAHDWSASPLGPPEAWPLPLKTAVRLILNTGHPMYVWWGPDLLCLYNDAYRRTLGPERHPGSLGKPGREVWAEIWHLIGHQVDYVMAGRGSTWDENRPVPITRFGRLDEIYWTYSYSPIDDETAPNGVGGVLVVCTETTQAVLAERRWAAETERQRRLFEQAPGFITILSGPEHVFEFANASYRRLFGDRGYVGKTPREAFPELADQNFFELLDRVYATGERFIAEHISIYLERTPGDAPEERFLTFIYEPIVDEAGHVTGIFVEGHDVTDAHRAETELRANAERQAFRLNLEERLRGLVDPVEAIAAASEALGRHLGVGQVAYGEVEPCDEIVLIEREWNDGSTKSNVGRHRLDDYGPEFIADLRRGQTVAISDVRIDPRTSSSEALAAFSRASILAFLNVPLVKAGRLVAVLAVHSATLRPWSAQEVALAEEIADRTWAAAERARAEVSLRKAEERYLALFNAIDQGFCAIEVAFDEHENAVDYRFLEISPSFERQTGIENGAGRWMREIAPDQDRHWFETYGRVALTGEPARFENYSTPLDRWFDVYAFRISGPRRVAVLFRDITDQKRAEVALREGEARLRESLSEAERKAAELRAILESMPDGVYIGTPEGITLANQPALDQLGFATYEDMNRHVGTLADEVQTRDAETGEPIAFEDQAFTRAFGGERVVRNVRVRHRLTGEERVVRSAAAPVVIDGRVIAAVAVNTDVTESRMAESELRESEARLAFLDRLGAATAPLADADAILATTTRLLGEHMNLSVCAYADMDEDQDGFTIRGDWAALGSRSILGHYSLAAFGKLAVKNLSAGLALVVNDNLRELAPEEASTFQSIGIAATICMPLVKEGRLTALMAIHDRVPRVWTEAELGLLREVTARSWAHVERVAATAELRASEARYRTLFETVDAGFCVVEMLFDDQHRPLDYRFVEANPAFERQTGLVGVVGRTARELVTNLEPDWFEQYARVALTGEPMRFENGADSMNRWFDVHALRVGDPQLRRVAILFNDISERRAAEERLRELNDTLEERVAERTAELEQAHEQLRQAQKMEAVGQLTGGVAHDFNNLLTIIKSSTDLLRRPDLAEERRRRYVDAISDTVDRASKLTGQLLAFARRQALKPEVFDVPERVRALGDMLRTIVGGRIQIVTEIACERCLTEADITQFETALVNMAVNARDAMDGEGVLTVRVESITMLPRTQSREGGAGEFVAVSLSDTGSGIEPEKLSQIFEPFFTTKEVGKGTGLGLSQVYGFAKQTGGDIDVESEVGQGTTFTLYLPHIEGSMPTQTSARQMQRDTGGGRRVLVVEDNREVGEFSSQLLHDLGYDTTWAANAGEALDCLENGQPFDVVFSDVVMPGMSGVDLGYEIRRRHPGLPVVLTSGYSQVLAEEGRHGFELLHKPYAVEDLSRLLRRVTRSR